MYTSNYKSPFGNIVLKSDGEYLVSLQFAKNTVEDIPNIDIFDKTKKWLDNYFSHLPNDFDIFVKTNGTLFQQRVWDIVRTIKYGSTMSYKDVASIYEKMYGTKTSCRAVGRAIGSNPILIIIPCHRVIGKNKKMIGYSAGIDKKINLLILENKKV